MRYEDQISFTAKIKDAWLVSLWTLQIIFEAAPICNTAPLDHREWKARHKSQLTRLSQLREFNITYLLQNLRTVVEVLASLCAS